jgi:hypothetical protein
MLSDEEFAQVAKHSDTFIEELRGQRTASGLDLAGLFATGWLPKILEEYKQLTGIHETNVNAIWHHLASIYGPPCVHCGKVLRTPEATFCFVCHRNQFEPDAPRLGAPKIT